MCEISPTSETLPFSDRLLVRHGPLVNNKKPHKAREPFCRNSSSTARCCNSVGVVHVVIDA